MLERATTTKNNPECFLNNQLQMFFWLGKIVSLTLIFSRLSSCLRGGVLGWLQQAGDSHHHRGRCCVSHYHRRVDLPVHKRPSQRGIWHPLSWRLIRVQLKLYVALTYEYSMFYIRASAFSIDSSICMGLFFSFSLALWWILHFHLLYCF